MIIDKAQLISLLEVKTGLEPEEVEEQLEKLVKRIQQAAEEDKTFEIEGFGTFSMEDDNVRFEPSDILETEINNKYAGMKPIELIGAFKEPDGDDIPTIEEDMEDTGDRVWAYDASSAEKEEPSEEPAVASGEELAGDEDDGEDAEKSEDPVISQEAAEAIFDMPENEGAKDQPAPMEHIAEEAESKDEPSEEQTVAADQEKEKDIMSQFLIAAVVVIAIGLSGWVAYDTGLIGAEEDSAADTRQAGVSAQQSGVGQEEATSGQTSSRENKDSEENISSEPEEELAVGKQEDLQEKEAEEESVFGLKGEVNETISDGYTIVVHSLKRIEEAENRKDNLQESGYRTLISKANVEGTTYYRVGLGQFENVDDALEAVSDIPEAFQSSQNHFVKRIQ